MPRHRIFAAAAVLLGFTAAADAQGINPEHLNLVTVENRTGGTVEYLFLSPGDSDYWSTDILGSTRVLSDDDDLGFYIHYPNECDDFDFMAIDKDGNAFILWDYQICDGAEAVIPLYSDAMQESAPDMDLGEITIVNETGYDIHYLFFSPSDSQMWGVDQLDKDTILTTGQSVSLLLPLQEYDVSYDVQAVDEDTDTYTFSVTMDNSNDAYTVSVEPSDLD